ncbi:zinc finger protein 746 [Etheostoma spectabile]|uniref:zinc finger protein 746 n=1 Tax=Etheostoma spectabile TaxID=54343 RepID=UPI0013AFA0DE|nr:zinc finger protein 746-like [Etheostoma spectabile]
MAALVLTGKALHAQLSVVMGALTKAAVAEICAVVDEGYAVLQMEISRSHRENEDLKKKLHLIESIVVRADRGGKAVAEPGFVPATEPGFVPAAESAANVETRQDSEGGNTAAAGGDVVLVQEELPDVVLIKDEDSDSDDSFDEDIRAPAAGGTAAARERVMSTPGGRRAKRPWPGCEEASQRPSAPVFTLDAPRGEPGCSGQETEAGDSSLGSCSSSSYCGAPMDPDVQLLHPDRPPYYGNGALITSQSPTHRPEPDPSLTWTKQPKTLVTFSHFDPNENLDGAGDAFGLKLISVTGSAAPDCQMSEGSNSAFEYDGDGGDAANFPPYGDPTGGPPQLGSGPPGGRARRYVCAVCAKTYATSQNLDVHMRIHTGQRPFSCAQCGKKFTQSAHLKSHLSVHSGERPHVCAVCARSFIVKYSLKLHVKKCHPDA